MWRKNDANGNACEVGIPLIFRYRVYGVAGTEPERCPSKVLLGLRKLSRQAPSGRMTCSGICRVKEGLIVIKDSAVAEPAWAAVRRRSPGRL
jgi:hypothetical protein